jgi:hypothetical protein
VNSGDTGRDDGGTLGEEGLLIEGTVRPSMEFGLTIQQ